jgi:predicted kinase
LYRSELADALPQGEELGSPTGASRPSSWSNVFRTAVPGDGSRRSTRRRKGVMSKVQATLFLMCGKIAAGKSALATKLATAPGTILISEDQWLTRLYRPELTTIADYIQYSARLRGAIGPHAEYLLRIGTSVVLDFPANTLEQRQWMRGIVERSGANHELHFLDVPDQICKLRLRERNAAGTHDFAASEAEFEQITSYFMPPADQEGFNVIRH